MLTIRKDLEQPLNPKNAWDLYSKYMALALASRGRGDRAKFEDYYQRAEYYLYCMNQLTALQNKASSRFKPSGGSYLDCARCKRQAVSLSPKGGWKSKR